MDNCYPEKKAQEIKAIRWAPLYAFKYVFFELLNIGFFYLNYWLISGYLNGSFYEFGFGMLGYFFGHISINPGCNSFPTKGMYCKLGEYLAII